jgi:hypothetical protein
MQGVIEKTNYKLQNSCVSETPLSVLEIKIGAKLSASVNLILSANELQTHTFFIVNAL